MSTETTLTAPQQRQIRVVEDDGPNAFLLDTARFEHLQRIATVMANCGLLPDHLLRGKDGPFTATQVISNCFLIVNQALRWGLDPFAVAPESYVVGGKLGFQGKLVAALVNTRGRLSKRLSYSFDGKGDALTVTVSGRLDGEESDRTVTLSVGQAKTSNKMWSTDPEQKLIYSAATKWARRHCPEVLLGVLTDDDLERMQGSTSREVVVEDVPRVSRSERLALEMASKSEATQPCDKDDVSRGDAETRSVKAEVASAAQPEANVPAPAKWSGVVPTLRDIADAKNLRRINQLIEEARGTFEAKAITPDVYEVLSDALAARQNEFLAKAGAA